MIVVEKWGIMLTKKLLNNSPVVVNVAICCRGFYGVVAIDCVVIS